MLNYPITLTPDDNGTVMATCKDFPEVTTFGDDNDDALLHATDAIEEAIAARIAHRQDVPAPSRGRTRAQLPTLTTLKAMLYISMREEGLTKAALARRLAWHAPQVDRLLDVRHASRVDQLDQAMAALNKRFTVDLSTT